MVLESSVRPVKPIALFDKFGRDVFQNVSKLALEPFRVIDDVYYVGNRCVGSYLLATTEDLMLIDTGFAETVPLLLDSIATLGFDARRIRFIVNSHMHIDHIGGNQQLVELTGARVCIHADDAEVARAGGSATMEDRCGVKCPPSVVGRELSDGDIIELSDRRLEVIHSPGHTPGSCCFLTRVEGGNQALTVCLLGGSGLFTFTPDGRRWGYPGDIEDYAKALVRLQALSVDVPLGSHPEHFDMLEKAEQARADPGVNPFIDPDGWTRKLSEMAAGFEKYQSSGAPPRAS